MSSLNITTNDNAKWSLKEPYFQSIIAAYIATYGGGISIQHLSFSDSSETALTKGNVPKQITSFIRFHLYFTVRIMRQLQTGNSEILNTFNGNFLKDHYAKWTWQEILH